MAEQQTSASTSASIENDFEAGKVIYETLKELPKPRQERILRWVSELLGILIAPQSPAPPAPPDITTPPPVDHRDTSRDSEGTVDIASYVREKNPRSDTQFVAVVAHYYRFIAPVEQRLQTITTTVAQDATRLANWDRLANPRSTLQNAVRQGYLDNPSRGEFAINTVGENLVARALPESGDASAARRPLKKKKGTKKARR